MARILIATSGLSGILYSSCALSVRLQSAGHQITYASPTDVRDIAVRHGLQYQQLSPVNFNPAPETDLSIENPVMRRIEEWRSASARRKRGIQALNMSNFKQFLDQLKPDLVLLDSELYEHVFCCWSHHYNTALISPFFATVRRRGLPPLEQYFIPHRSNWSSNLNLRIRWLNVYWRHRLRALKVSLRYAFTERRAVLKAYARQCSYPLKKLNEFTWITLFNDNHLPMISMTSQHMDFDHELRSGFYYAGVQVSAQHRSTQQTKLLKDFIALSRSSERKLIYCALTTMAMPNDNWTTALLEAVRSQPDWMLILSHSGKKATTPSSGDNIFFVDFLDQAEMLKQSDLCITHGGVNTINESLLNEVPLLIYPYPGTDNPGCAARAVFRGVAHVGSREDDTLTIQHCIKRVLSDHRLKENLRHMRQQLNAEISSQSLEKTVNQLLECDHTARDAVND